MTIINSYHNINFKNKIILPKKNKLIISRIKDNLKNLASLNIVKNKKLLDYTIKEVLGFSKSKKIFLIFGTGGSNLGGRALINILQGNTKNKIIFFDNIDPINFKNQIDKIDLRKAGFIIISKSGSTPETLAQFASIIEIFDHQKNLNLLYKNSLFITEDKLSPLYNIAKNNNSKILFHEKNVGGRYSIFSNVGMVPAIIAGLDVKKIHAGALDAINTIRHDEYVKIAHIFRYQNFLNTINTSVLMTYSDSLFYFGKWYLQLWAESLGKNKKGITAIHSVGTTDQHSQLQLYLDGPRDKFFTFFTTDHSNKGFKLHTKTMKENNINYLTNKKMGDLMEAEQKATIETFKKNNFLLREFYIPKINEFNIGKIMAFSIMETISTCFFYDVNPFDQPAVEAGKLLTKKYLS